VRRSLYIVLCWCLVVTLRCYGQRSDDWLPVTSQSLAIREVAADPGAPAVQLYYADFRDDNSRYEFIYRSIKILAEAGRSYANVEIPVRQGYLLEDLQARTIHPDGTIVPFTGKPYDKLLIHYRDDKITAKSFTFSDVTVGSIVEYKYRLTWDVRFYDPVWTVQHDLYTLKESFWLRPYKGPIRTRTVADETRLSYVYSNMPPGVQPKDTGAGIALDLENMPAFKPEKHMPPENNFIAQVLFFYGGREIESPDVFWRDLGKEWYGKADHFIGNHSEIKTAAAEITGTETDPQQKLRRLYDRVQQIRNLDFERERTRLEDKREDLKPNDTVVDVLNRGYGYRNEIAELFVALARAAGFEVDLLRASDRKRGIFDVKLLSARQLEAEIVRVPINGSLLYLDPGTKYCPFGIITWAYTSTPALKLDKSGGALAVVPTATADKNIIRRVARVHLDAGGSLRGEIIIECKGNAALRRRLDALATDDAGRRQMLEDELLAWLPQGSGVRLKDAQGWDSSQDVLIASFDVEVPRFAASAGKRLLLPANLFRSPQIDGFGPAQRKYPLYFPYTYEELDNVTVQLPGGFSVQNLPDGQDIKLKVTRFITTRSSQGDALVQTRALVINSIYFQPEQYAEIRGFFNRLKAADEEQIVLAPAQPQGGGHQEVQGMRQGLTSGPVSRFRD